jgi:hypothetical protein
MDINLDQFTVKHQNNNQSMDNRFYSLIGDEDYLDDDLNPRLNKEDNKTIAKALKKTDNLSYRYFIKIGAYGKIYNPISIYDPDSKQPKFMTRVRKSEWEFQEVSPKVFDYYINFLRTKNTAWLNNAEREQL